LVVRAEPTRKDLLHFAVWQLDGRSREYGVSQLDDRLSGHLDFVALG
jgi:hypothetical protein